MNISLAWKVWLFIVDPACCLWSVGFEYWLSWCRFKCNIVSWLIHAHIARFRNIIWLEVVPSFLKSESSICWLFSTHSFFCSIQPLIIGYGFYTVDLRSLFHVTHDRVFVYIMHSARKRPLTHFKPIFRSPLVLFWAHFELMNGQKLGILRSLSLGIYVIIITGPPDATLTICDNFSIHNNAPRDVGYHVIWAAYVSYFRLYHI